MSKRDSSGANRSEDEETNSNKDDSKKAKISFSSKKEPLTSSAIKKGIQIKLGGGGGSGGSQKDKASSGTVLKVPSKTVASVFGEESDDEPEEMPPEARMRMRNIGRDTPTSAGPNSYGKTKQGFCNVKKVFEKTLKEAELEYSNDKPKSNTKI